MAKTQDLRRRIRSIRNTMQLTRAMKMVSAAKLRRAQDRILRARPYARRIREILRSVAARAGAESHPLLQRRGDERVLVIVVTADKGLCGSFNAGVIRTATNFVRSLDPGRAIALSVVGKKGRDYFGRRGPVTQTWVDVFRVVDFATAKSIADELMAAYVDGRYDLIFLVYNEFKSAIQARPVVQQLLPIEPREVAPDEVPGDFIYEPDPAALLDALLPHYVEMQVFQALLESAAAEHAARMAAMDSATNNAGELIDSLTLTMNRVRQASITTEIIEVVSGAQALG
jgi:F-type H+-transporting ATPase subunit gamma